MVLSGGSEDPFFTMEKTLIRLFVFVQDYEYNTLF